MGAYNSTQEEWHSNKLLVKLVDSKTHIPKEDEFWTELLSFHPRITIKDNGSGILQHCKDLTSRLAANNPVSANVPVLLNIFLEKSSRLSHPSESEVDNEAPLHAYNALFMLRCFLQALTELFPGGQIVNQLTLSNFPICDDDENDASKSIREFIDSLFRILIQLPISEKTYFIHLEAINTLFVLLSPDIFGRSKNGRHQMYNLLFEHEQADNLCKALLNRFVEQQKMPLPDKLLLASGGSIILDLAADIIGYFMPTDNGTPLARSALLLVIVLANHRVDWKIPGKYRQYISTLTEGLTEICTTICSAIDSEETTLFLYNLLQRNSNFKPLLVAQEDISWIIPMLQNIYKASDSSGHHMYMSLIILLILTEDREFNRKIHTTMIKNVTWYTDRHLGEISLGGLTILVTTRTVQYNLLKMRDEYLHTNCLAALSNMSSQFTNLHPYVCQRLVGLFEVLAKTYNRTKHQLIPIERALRIILEVLNSCLSNQLVSNTNLIYTLLYKREIFEPFRTNTAFNDIINNLDQVLEYFTTKLEKSNEPCNDVNTVLSIIVEAAPKWPSHRLQKFPELKFKYVEEECPGEFFIPYIWSLVSQYTFVQWGIPVQQLEHKNVQGYLFF